VKLTNILNIWNGQKKNNCHLYRDMENEFDDDTILEPRQRKPLGSIYQFIFLTTNPKLKDYPSRQKSLFMTTSHGGSGSEDVFGRYQYECFLKKGINIGFALEDFNCIFGRSNRDFDQCMWESSIILINFYDKTKQTVQDIQKYFSQYYSGQSIENLSEYDKNRLESCLSTANRLWKEVESSGKVGHFVLNDFDQLKDYFSKKYELWTDSPCLIKKTKTHIPGQ